MLRTLLLFLIACSSLTAKVLKGKSIRKAARYIETKAPSSYVPKHKSGLKYPIECAPRTGECFIILEDKKNYIGSGAHKKVYKAIHYKKHPKVVARSVEKTKSSREWRITKKMEGKPGIFKVLGFGQYKDYRSMYAKLYRPGSLHNLLEKRYKLSMKQKIKIALDILTGLATLHEAKVVHRDLSARNFLVDISKSGKVEAAIIDFGHAMYAKKAAGIKVTGNPKYRAPEGLFIKKMRGKKYYKTDIFTVGCTLYWLYYGKQPSWFSKSYRYKKLRRDVEAVRRKKPHNAFEALILEMLHTDPEKRPSAKILLKRFENYAGERI